MDPAGVPPTPLFHGFRSASHEVVVSVTIDGRQVTPLKGKSLGRDNVDVL
jgi:hypothetical protein